jgi:hypothetical protein
LADAYRLDLALHLAFADTSRRLALALLPHAPAGAVADLLEDQTRHAARHHDAFARRLDVALAGGRPETREVETRMLPGRLAPAATLLPRDAAVGAVLIPPLGRYIERCEESAAVGDVLETLTRWNLVQGGMAGPLYRFKVRYWEPVHPAFAALLRQTGADAARHLTRGTDLVGLLLDDMPGRQSGLAALCGESQAALRDVFGYYVRKFVALFALARRANPQPFARVELSPGQPLAQAPPADQEAAIVARCADGCFRTLTLAGLDDGQPESLSHP